MNHRHMIGLLALLLASFGCCSAWAQKTWTGGVASNWFQAGNWDPSGPPTATDDVHISRPNQLNWPVVFNDDGFAVARDVFMAHGQIGRLWVESNSTLTVRDIDIGNNGEQALLTVWGGAELNSQISRIGLAANSPGGHNNWARVRDSGSRWNNSGGLAVGHGAGGKLDVEGGALVSTGALIVGTQAAGVGEVRIDGLDSRLSSSGPLVVGRFGSGEVTLSQMATLQANVSIVLAEQANSSGDLILQSAVAGIVDAPDISGGAGTARVILDHIQSNYVFERPSGSPVNLTGSLLLMHTNIGQSRLEGQYNHSGGTAAFNGELIFHGAQLEHPAAPVVVAQNSGHTGALYIREGSTATVGQTWVGFQAGSWGNLLLTQNSELNVNGALIAGQGGSGFIGIGGSQLNAGAIGIGMAHPVSAQAEVIVNGPNGLLNSLGVLQIGGSGQGSARLEAFGGGRVTVAGNLLVGSTGGGASQLLAGTGGGVTIGGALNLDAGAELLFGVDEFAPGWIESESVTIQPGVQLTVELIGGAPDPSETIVLIDTSGGISGTFASTNLPSGWVLDQTATQIRLNAGAAEDQIFSDRFR